MRKLIVLIVLSMFCFGFLVIDVPDVQARMSFWERVKVKRCGNGRVESWEQCDGGANCNADCTLKPVAMVSIPEINSTLQDYLTGLKRKIIPRASDEYVIPTVAEQADFYNAMDELLNADDFADEVDDFENWGYKVSYLNDLQTGERYLVVEENEFDENGDNEKGWGTIFVNVEEWENGGQWHIQSPHSLYETNSENLAMAIFDEMDAVSFVMAGAHRYSSDGADLANFDDSIFEMMNEYFAESSPDGVVLQVHGFSLSKHRDYPEGTQIILGDASNGVPSVKRIDFAESLRAAGFEVQVCGDGWGTGMSSGSLCATNNVQGNILNSDPDNYAEFIHMEVEYAVRRNWEEYVDRLLQ
jgi:hypothetical protein